MAAKPVLEIHVADDMDYAELYRDVNQVTRPVATRQCSEVMAVHRMYFRLDDLHVDNLRNSQVVKQLYVFADVVEVEGDSVELPGSGQVSIFCRVLKLKRSEAAIRLSMLEAVRCTGRQRRTALGQDVEYYWVTPQNRLDGAGPVVTVLAAQLVTPPGDAQLRLTHPLIVDARVYDSDGYHPDFFTSNGTMEWRISTPTNGSSNTNPERTCGARTVIRPGIQWRAFEEEWYPSFRVLVAEAIPPEMLDNSNVLLGMESTTLISELVMAYQREAKYTMAATLRHVEWLNHQLLAVNQDIHSNFQFHHKQQIQSLHFRVQSLLKLPNATDDAKTLIVPPLQYNVYSNLISLMTQAAQSYDNDFKNLNLFMQQNEILGSFLLEQNKAFAAKERDMESHHSQLVNLQEEQLVTAKARVDRLHDQLERESQAMDEARADMEAGIREYRNRLVAQAFFAVIQAVAAVCLAAFTGGATAAGAVGSAKQLSEAAQALQSVVELLERIEQIVEMVNAVTDFLSALESLNQMIELPEMPELPSTADWDIFENEIVAVAEGMPTEISEVPVWKAKSLNVAALGREIITTVAYIQQLQYDLGVNGMLQRIAQQQAERLESLQIQDLDNYLEMATELDMRTSRMLMNLLKVLTLQTAALSYHYLLPPRPLIGWVRMDSVWNALVRNAYDAVIALSSLGPSTDFVRTYDVKEIPVGLLLSGQDWIFDISINDSTTFPSSWSRIRIEYVELKFPTDDPTIHLPTTHSGQVYFLLQANRFFDDRLRGDVMHYQAAEPLAYQYAYRLENGETTTSNRPSVGSSTHYMRMTPFTRWRLRMSASAAENQGLSFPSATTEDATTQISLTFYLTAIRAIDTRHAIE